MTTEYFPNNIMLYRKKSHEVYNPEFEMYDPDIFTIGEGDVRYVKVGDDLVGTAISLLTEAGYEVAINITSKEEPKSNS